MKFFQVFKFYKPGLGESWWLVLLVMVGSVIMSFAAEYLCHSAGYFLMMLLPLVWGWWRGMQNRQAGVSPLKINDPHFGKLHPVLFFVLISVAMLALSVVFEPTTNWIPMPDWVKSLFEEVFVKSKLWDMILATCILAPLMEEFLCRGLMLRGMLKSKGPVKAICWSAFLFAFMHLNPWQSIPAFLIGLFLGWVYWRTHCLWATIFLHFLNNSISTVISRVWPDLPIDAGWIDILPTTTYWIVYGCCVIVSVVTIYILHEKTVSPQIPSPVDA